MSSLREGIELSQYVDLSLLFLVLSQCEATDPLQMRTYLTRSKSKVTNCAFERTLLAPKENMQHLLNMLTADMKPSVFDRAADFAVAAAGRVELADLEKLAAIIQSVKGTAKAQKKMAALLTEHTAPGEEHPLETYCDQTYGADKAAFMSKAKACKMKLGSIAVPYADMREKTASAFVVACAIAPYLKQLPDGYTLWDAPEFVIDPQADHVAAGLDREALLQVLLQAYGDQKVPAPLNMMIPLCRYADEKTIRHIIAQMPRWKTKHATIGKRCHEVTGAAILLSDQREAMIYAEKVERLETYAQVHHKDIGDVQLAMVDFGFDAAWQRVFDLGAKTAVVTLNADLSLSLTDAANGKAMKSFPKKGNDPERVAEATEEYASLKNSLKKFISLKNGRLFGDFLTGNAVAAAQWQHDYMKNPVLQRYAGMLVWEQNGHTFTLLDGALIGADGMAYTMDESPVRLAYPTEMSPDEVNAWQKYLCARQLKQPFEQIWEPVHLPEEIHADRYVGSRVGIHAMRNAKKHGVDFYDEDFHDAIGFELEDCDIAYERTEARSHAIEPGDTFTLGEFTFDRYTRQVNHIVCMLDRWTLRQRILKDDCSIGSALTGMTQAQIAELLHIAVENESAGCTAILLDYQNKHFAPEDWMESFTLE